MRLIILLAMLAIALPFIISQAAMPYGVAVSLRFLERPTNSLKPKYTIPAESDNAVTVAIHSKKLHSDRASVPLRFTFRLDIVHFGDPGRRDQASRGDLEFVSCGICS